MAHNVEAPDWPEQRDEKPANTESPVREGKRPGLAPDSGYGPSLRAKELVGSETLILAPSREGHIFYLSRVMANFVLK